MLNKKQNDMTKIIIPSEAQCFASAYGELCYHVYIDDERAFEVFCQTNNIGYHEGARIDVVKSYLHVFSKTKEIFENYPDKVELLS